MVNDATRPWNQTLLVSRIIAAMVHAEKLGATISANAPFERDIAEQCRHAFGRLTMKAEKSPFEGTQDRIVMAPEGGLMTELWDALKVIRQEWLALRMIEAGYKRDWYDVIGDKSRRAAEHYATLESGAPTVEDAIRAYREAVRLREGLAA